MIIIHRYVKSKGLLFKMLCEYCDKLIDIDQDVYMYNDKSYCSYKHREYAMKNFFGVRRSQSSTSFWWQCVVYASYALGFFSQTAPQMGLD